MLPPMLLHMRFGTSERHGLWLPLFLVWLILLPFVVLVLLIAAVADVAMVLGGAPYHRNTLMLFRGLGVLTASQGTTVRIHSNQRVVNIDLV
jgi:hypothetical protein